MRANSNGEAEEMNTVHYQKIVSSMGGMRDLMLKEC